jgi:hypothetical protein
MEREEWPNLANNNTNLLSGIAQGQNGSLN